MPEQIYIGNFAKGLTTNPLPFNIDNDAFPTMFNFYSWRGRAKRKRGTLFLGQLQRQLQSVVSPNNWQMGIILTLDDSGNGSANLISVFSLGASASLTPGSFTLSDGTNTYTESSPANGTLIGVPGGSGTINYTTGALTITGGAAGQTLIGTFSYFPALPVMGLRNLVSLNSSSQYPLLIAFDTKYSYQINQSGSSVFFYSVSYYKSTDNPVIWSGQDYQQFWTTNYSAALWATNGKPGFHFKPLSNVMGVSVTQVSATQVTLTIATPSNLVPNDLLWINEVTGTIATGSGSTANQNINGQTGIVVSVTSGGGNDTVTVNFTGANGTSLANFQGGATGAAGIAQYLTNSIAGQDGIRWYDGDPTNGTGLPTTATVGWANFAPPLTALTVSIDNTPAALYYLVGAQAIVPFKDRLLFFNVTIQTSTGSPITLQDTAIWSWNGTPYYTALRPAGETFDITAYYVDQTGKGGYLPAGISQPIVTVANNEDVLLVGFGGDMGRQTRFVYTGDDFNPFLFFSINSELGSSATFSAVTLDRGAITIGSYGIVMTTQESAQRIDLSIPDSVFQIQNLNNGVQRVNAVRDFFKEWIYFAYPVNSSPWKFPTQSFFYNYRDDTWAIFYENFTAHGTYRKSTHYTWATLPFKTWAQWREPWNSGSTSALFPSIVGGNPQGYVLIKGEGTGEGVSGSIAAIASSMGNAQITSTNHCVNVDDYLLIQGILGLLSSTITAITLGNPTIITTVNTFTAGQFVTISGVVGTTQLNGNTYKIFSATGASITLEVDSTTFTSYISGGTVTSAINNTIGRVIATPDANTFVIDLPVPVFTTVYLGLGRYVRLSQPLLQSKQFPVYWGEGRQVRLGAQKYLMDRTANAQVTLNIYLSQDPDDAWNDPMNNVPPNSLVYSQTLFTCPESTNIGLTPPNTNLQMPTAASQYQIWHRLNTSLIGDSVQFGITLDDAQMRNLTYATSEITLHGMHLTVEKGPHLA